MDSLGSVHVLRSSSLQSRYYGKQVIGMRVCDARLHLASPSSAVTKKSTESPSSLTLDLRAGKSCQAFSYAPELRLRGNNGETCASQLSRHAHSGAENSSPAVPESDAFATQELDVVSSLWKRHLLAGMAAVSIFSSPSLQAASADTLPNSPNTVNPVEDVQYPPSIRSAAVPLRTTISQTSAPALSVLDDRQMPPTFESLKGSAIAPAYLDLTRRDESAYPAYYADPSLVVTSMGAVGSFGAVGGACEVAVEAAAPILQPVATAGLGARLSTILAKAVQHFGGGSVAGAVGIAVVYPLDTIKVRMQSQRGGKDGEKPEYENEVDCLVQVVKEEGVGALYCGLGPQLVGVAPEKAIKLTVNELLLSILESFLPGARIWTLELFAGGGGGFSQVVFTNPVEIVKVRLQTQPHDGSPSKTTLDVIKELGLKGLYSGSLVTMARDVPSSALFFAAYVFLKEQYPDQLFLDGCLAAIPSTLLVTPLDVIKTRLQMEPVAGEEVYKGPIDCAQKMVRREGVGSLFKGGITRVMRVSPQFGITLCIYDMLSK